MNELEPSLSHWSAHKALCIPSNYHDHFSARTIVFLTLIFFFCHPIVVIIVLICLFVYLYSIQLYYWFFTVYNCVFNPNFFFFSIFFFFKFFFSILYYIFGGSNTSQCYKFVALIMYYKRWSSSYNMTSLSQVYLIRYGCYVGVLVSYYIIDGFHSIPIVYNKRLFDPQSVSES